MCIVIANRVYLLNQGFTGNGLSISVMQVIGNRSFDKADLFPESGRGFEERRI